MKCSKCGTEFEGKFCPECATPTSGQPTVPEAQPVQPTYQNPVAPQKKKRGPKGVLIVLGVIVVIAIISSIVNGGKTTPTKAEATKSTAGVASTVSNHESSAAEQTTFGVNEPVKLNNIELTVAKVEKSNGSEYNKPKSGMEFVIVTVKYKNTGKEDTVSYNPFDFKMKNSKGQITDETFTTVNQDTALSSGNLAPGGEIEGTIAFEQPKGDKALVLQYTGNIFKTDSEIDFKLN